MVDSGSKPALAHGAAVRCPRCAHRFAADLVIIADADRDPRWHRRALSAGVNRLRCPHCAADFCAETPLLYVETGLDMALAYIPEALQADDDAIRAALVGRYLQALPAADGIEASTDLADYLLEPTVVRSLDDLPTVLAERGARDEASGGLRSIAPFDHPHLTESLRWAQRRNLSRAVEVLDLLVAVDSEAALIGALNDQPRLVEPATVAALDAAAGQAEQDALDEVAALLRDVIGLLHTFTPEEQANDDDRDEVPEQVRGLLLALDLEAAGEYLEAPDTRLSEDAERAVLRAQPEEAELREGFYDHATLFGGLVDDMLQPATPDSFNHLPAPPVPHSEELPEKALQALVAAPTLEIAAEVIASYPVLISAAGVQALERAAHQARDRDHDAHANHYEMLIAALYVADEDGLLDAEGDGDARSSA